MSTIKTIAGGLIALGLSQTPVLAASEAAIKEAADRYKMCVLEESINYIGRGASRTIDAYLSKKCAPALNGYVASLTDAGLSRSKASRLGNELKKNTFKAAGAVLVSYALAAK